MNPIKLFLTVLEWLYTSINEPERTATALDRAEMELNAAITEAIRYNGSKRNRPATARMPATSSDLLRANLMLTATRADQRAEGYGRR